MSGTTAVLPATHDFDFLWGSWAIENTRLRSRLTGSGDWETFAATGTCRPILRGSGNIDDFTPVDASAWSGFEGGALRLCDPETGRWSIFWFDNVVHRLLPPVHGYFVNGIGEFFGDDEHDGQPVLVRYRWHGITPVEAHWEQAFSTDEGQTWETNWRMHFTRAAETA
ncbi:MAG: hypothetical protein QM692_10750 [Thermomicrobiales bacterium]